jgi:hypothetical protein
MTRLASEKPKPKASIAKVETGHASTNPVLFIKGEICGSETNGPHELPVVYYIITL